MRYQELLVIALSACHMADSTAPLGLHPRGIPGPGGGTASPVRAQGTRTELTQRSVAHPHEAARVILPGIDGAFA
jgi:hypothetical protein